MEYGMLDRYRLIKEELLKETDTNPIRIIKRIMKKDFVSIHGPEHHYLDGASVMVAIYNSGFNMKLEDNLDILAERSIKMPGAMCGLWGICGSVASICAVFSIIDNTGPLSNDIFYAKHMELASNIINTMSKIGGPRCCKRNAFVSITKAIEYANSQYNLNIEIDKIECEFSPKNAQCLKKSCPFYRK